MPIVREINTAKPTTSGEAGSGDGSETKKVVEKIFGDISKASASKQILIGVSTGWLSGYLAMKVGKAAAVAVGGGIILLEVANEMGYIKINWNKINKGFDKVTDRVEETITGKGPGVMDKMERFVDNKLDKAEELLDKGQKKAKSLISSRNGNSNYKVKDIHIFTLSFIAGLALGVGTF